MNPEKTELSELIKKEALRYLGFGSNEPDSVTLSLLEKAVKELSELPQKPSYCYAVLNKEDAGYLLMGADINDHLEGCQRVIFFAATLGSGADRLIRTAEISNMAYAVILDAAASAYIESVCDETEKELKPDNGSGYTWRYSPGYGDYPLTVQPDIIRLLNADKKIGLTVTQSGILIPRKSVTALIGVSESYKEINRQKHGCESCSLKDSCKFRKENKGCGRR